MGVRTAADEHRDSAREHVSQALGDLHEIIVKRCWGHDEYNEEYAERYRQAYKLLVDVDELMHDKRD